MLLSFQVREVWQILKNPRLQGDCRREDVPDERLGDGGEGGRIGEALVVE